MSSSAKTAWRVLGIIASVFLSIALIAMLIAAPIISATTSIVKPSTITDILRNIDLSALTDTTSRPIAEEITTPVAKARVAMPTDIDLDDIAETEQAKELLAALLQTPLADDIVELYIDDVTTILNGNAASSSLTPEALQAIAAKHMDDIITIVQQHIPEAANISKDELQQQITDAINQNSDDILAALPDANELTELAEDIRTIPAVTMLFSRTLPWILYGTIAMLAVLIFFCLYGRARGLLCLGIDALIACLPLFAVAMLLGDGSDIVTLIGAPTAVSSVLVPAIVAVSSKILLSAIILAVAAVACIAGYIAYNIYRKKTTTTTSAINEIPVEVN